MAFTYHRSWDDARSRAWARHLPVGGREAMTPPREVWFAPSAVRGFGVVHWKGPAFILGMALVGIPAALFSLANSERYSALAALGAIIAMGAIILGYFVCTAHTAARDEDDDAETSIQANHWRVLPRWAKAVSIGVGLPAWIVLASGVVTGRWDTPINHAAFITFAAVAVLQTALLFRSYWKMEL
jgi:hypothetical protein